MSGVQVFQMQTDARYVWIRTTILVFIQNIKMQKSAIINYKINQKIRYCMKLKWFVKRHKRITGSYVYSYASINSNSTEIITAPSIFTVFSFQNVQNSLFLEQFIIVFFYIFLDPCSQPSHWCFSKSTAKQCNKVCA